MASNRAADEHCEDGLGWGGLVPTAAERSAERIAKAQADDRERLRRQLAEANQRIRDLESAAFTLTARLCGIATVGEIDGYEVIRRDSAMEFVTRWRMQRDEAVKQHSSKDSSNG